MIAKKTKFPRKLNLDKKGMNGSLTSKRLTMAHNWVGARQMGPPLVKMQGLTFSIAWQPGASKTYQSGMQTSAKFSYQFYFIRCEKNAEFLSWKNKIFDICISISKLQQRVVYLYTVIIFLKYELFTVPQLMMIFNTCNVLS